jgi:hypothetical protein
MMEALSSFETAVPTGARRHNNPEDYILHSHRRENLKSSMECAVIVAGLGGSRGDTQALSSKGQGCEGM